MMRHSRHIAFAVLSTTLAAAASAAPQPGILVSDGLSMWAGARIDAPGGKAVVATNATRDLAVQMGGQAVIDGDIFCGPGADPDDVVARWGSARVTGDLASLEESFETPTIDTPKDQPQSEGSFQLVGNQEETFSSDRRFVRLSLYGDSILSIEGDVTLHVDNSIDMSGDAEIRISDGSSLSLYVGGNIGIHGTARINAADADPGVLSIFVTGRNRHIELTTDARLGARIQSEDARLRVWNTAEFTGSFVGRSVEMGSSARIHVTTGGDDSIDGDLIAHYRFDESSGRIAADSVGGYDAALENMKGDQWSAGRVQGALRFDGGRAVAVVPNAAEYLEELDQITVSVWVKADRIGHDRGVFTTKKPKGTDDVLSLRYDRGGWAGGEYHLIKAAIRTDEGYMQVEGESNLQTTDWQHIALTWRTGDPVRLFVNGKESEISARHPGQGPLSGVIDGVDRLIIAEGVKDRNWEGAIDDLRFYRRALDQNEIASLAGSAREKMRFYKWAEVSPID